MDWKGWFEGYANDWRTGEVRAVAERYAPTFLNAGPRKLASYANDDKLVDWLQGVGAWHRDSGLERVEVVTVRDVPLGEHAVLVSVTWAVRFQRTDRLRIQFDISYVLVGDPPRIAMVLSHEDQRDKMRRYELL
jgi:hypothetical protein